MNQGGGGSETRGAGEKRVPHLTCVEGPSQHPTLTWPPLEWVCMATSIVAGRQELETGPGICHSRGPGALRHTGLGGLWTSEMSTGVHEKTA